MARLVSRIAPLVLSIAACLAQPHGSGVISGTVVYKSSSAPVRKAVVILAWHGSPRSWAAVQSDASGRFSFDSLPPGKYDLRATRQGVGTAIYGGDGLSPAGEFITLAEGERRDGFILRLSRPASISGVVLDSDAEPVMGSEVLLFVVGYPRGGRELVQYGGVITNDRGEYRIPNVAPGEYYLAVSYRTPEMGASGSQQNVARRQFYGGSTDWKRAAHLTVQSGEQVAGIDFRLAPPGRTISVRGRVTGLPDASLQAGMPALPVLVALTAVTGDPASQNTAYGEHLPDNSFEFPGVMPGLYYLTARVQTGQRSYWARQTIDVRDDLADLTLSLAPATELKGQVRFEGEPAGKPANFQVQLVSGERAAFFGSGRLTTGTGPDGRFTLAGVPPGIWDIGVTPIQKGGYIKAMQLGKQDVLTEEMEIGPNTDSPLDIVISAHGAQIEGEVDSEAARRKLEYDLYYIKNRGPMLDGAILLYTIRVVLQMQGR